MDTSEIITQMVQMVELIVWGGRLHRPEMDGARNHNYNHSHDYNYSHDRIQ